MNITNTTDILIVTTAVFIGFTIYLVPALVGAKNKNAKGVFLVNLFLGWMLIGWVIALYMAITGEKAGHKYTCSKCNLKSELQSEVTIYVCPNCKHENHIK